jgi:DNA-binding protein WhiA
LAELLGIINAASEPGLERLTLTTDNAGTARQFIQLIKNIFQLNANETIHEGLHTVIVPEGPPSVCILQAAGCRREDGTVSKYINPMAVANSCCKRAYIRGSFIAAGRINDPDKPYHLEFAYPAPDGGLLAQGLGSLLGSFGIKPKITARKAITVVYVKESEGIADILNIMEAHKCLLRFENNRVVKDMRNAVNRKVNFETANLNKTVGAAVEQIEDIRYIAGRVGLGYLSKPLEEVARLRLQYESATLKEIGGYLSIPIGKSGINHRLRKISEIAETLRHDEEAINI